MSAIGAVVGSVAAAQVTQASQAMKPVDRDGDHDNNMPEQAKEARAAAQHKVNVEA